MITAADFPCRGMDKDELERRRKEMMESAR
jgi:hypothetical protein